MGIQNAGLPRHTKVPRVGAGVNKINIPVGKALQWDVCVYTAQSVCVNATCTLVLSTNASVHSGAVSAANTGALRCHIRPVESKLQEYF